MNYPSKHIEAAVQEFCKLPGIGKKTALRLVLHLLKQPVGDSELFGNTIVNMRQSVRFCASCHNIADAELCNICSSPQRDHAMICVAENLRDVMAIENTQQYNGVFHVLGGVISPIDGIGPDKLQIESLLNKVRDGKIREVIMALNPTMEGDTTIFYISKKIKTIDKNTNITSIARGVAFGGELEYVDELTLARSIAARMPYERYMIGN